VSVKARLQDVIDYIDTHLKDAISIAALAEVAGYSPWHLYHVFMGCTGRPVMEYVRLRRLHSAVDELAQGRKLLDIAVDYGFETQAGFYKAFQRHFGCSPTRYRIHKQRPIKYQISLVRLDVARGGADMKDRVIIRTVRQEDADDLWENVYSANTPNEVKDRVASYVQAHADGKAIPLVAEVDGHVVATTYVTLKEPDHPAGHICTLFDVVVNPAFQRMGIARRLIEECKTRAAEQGKRMMCVSARGGRMAETVYRKLGFIEYGRLPNGIMDTWRTKTPSTSDEVLFYMPLTERA
jgi:AraC-like DNA-binding protein/ribosomal protein S18 acetylase RimI-like enzyme